MFNSKKGVSEVVANVLIVLLVIVGIAVIWSVVKPTIDKGAAGIGSAGDCFSVQVQPFSCVAGNAVGQWDVTIKRNPGAGAIDAVELVFQDSSGSSRVTTGLSAFSGIAELETKTAADVIKPTTLTGTGLTVNTVLRIGGQLCQVTSQPVNCA